MDIKTSQPNIYLDHRAGVSKVDDKQIPIKKAGFATPG